MMTEKTMRHGKVSVSTWLTPEEVERLDYLVEKKARAAQTQYPGMRLTRHSLVQEIIRKWLASQKGK